MVSTFERKETEGRDLNLPDIRSFIWRYFLLSINSRRTELQTEEDATEMLGMCVSPSVRMRLCLCLVVSVFL